METDPGDQQDATPRWPNIGESQGAPPDRDCLSDSQLLKNNKKQQETIAAQTRLIEKISLLMDMLQRQINKLLKSESPKKRQYDSDSESSTVNETEIAKMQEDSLKVSKNADPRRAPAIFHHCQNVIRYNRIIGSSETSNHKLDNSAIESTIMLVKVIFLQMRQSY
ncbi:unnamed protein product [Acanthoscelides obtectus]|uniref:Uncharacterized protein n=1 Tax=Acanthoscelides obtectus TaxID=200917 RepID=A0A9P0Q4E3_ACAOB|nr:unnamed protein product [Acanthoscelides obtectus]CAK1669054.1 hypothetical protein AOBTE_LOCUS26763 [Acanthoscelides obtectus]